MEGAEKYHRQIDLEGNSSVAQLVRWIKPHSKVLEMGPATGIMTRVLKEVKQCDVTCVEVDAQAAERAVPFCTRILVEDLNLDRWLGQLDKERFDYITFADVLEHLVDPVRTLTQALKLLKPEGEVLISLPNIGYSGVAAELLQGRFEYRRDGLMDETHLRFFTRHSVVQLLQKTGLVGLEWSRTVLPLERSEFRIRPQDLGTTLRSLLAAIPDGDTYQYLVRASRSGVPAVSAVPPLKAVRAPGFFAQLFFDTGNGFSEEHSTIVPIPSAEESVTLKIPTPAGLQSLRVDPVDCRFPVLVQSISVTSDDQEVFSWDPRISALASVGRIENASEVLFDTFSVVLPTSEDPLVVLPVVAENRGEVEISLSLNLGKAVFESVSMLQQAILDRDKALMEKTQEMAHYVASADSALVAERKRAAELAVQLQLLRSSRSWRLTRPLRIVTGLSRGINQAVRETLGRDSLRRRVFDAPGIKGGGGLRRVLRACGVISPYEDRSLRSDFTKEMEGSELRHRPLLSIVLPTYKTDPNMLRQCLESVRSQMYTEWELCVVDTGSDSPGIRSLLASFSDADRRIKVIFLGKGSQISDGCTEGLRIATGEYVSLLNHEDVLDSSALFKVVREIDRDPSLEIVRADEDLALRDGGRAPNPAGSGKVMWMKKSGARAIGGVLLADSVVGKTVHLAEVIYHRRIL